MNKKEIALKILCALLQNPERYKYIAHLVDSGEITQEPYSFGLEDETVYKYSSLEIKGYKWENKLFMPAKYARYFIEITGVRCERLQDISDEDCLKEGIERCNLKNHFGVWENDKFTIYGFTPRDDYAALFDKINGKGTWDSNPLVWIYDYKLIK